MKNICLGKQRRKEQRERFLMRQSRIPMTERDPHKKNCDTSYLKREQFVGRKWLDGFQSSVFGPINFDLEMTRKQKGNIVQ